MAPSQGRRPTSTELLPGLSLRTALILVMGVWVTCTLIMFHQHSFVAVSRFDYSDHVLSSLPMHPLRVSHLAEIETNAAQSVALVPIDDNPHRPYALVLVANYFGSSGLFLLRPHHRPHTKPLAVLQTECGHSWDTWEQGGRRWAAVANYCTKEKQKSVVVYELEQLATSTSSEPDWGFKAAAALAAEGASKVLHLSLPPDPGAATPAARRRRQHALAVAEYGSGDLVVYDLSTGEAPAAAGTPAAGDKGEEKKAKGRSKKGEGSKGHREHSTKRRLGEKEEEERAAAAEEGRGPLVASELQRIRLPGVSSLAACSLEDGGGGEQLFLVGLSYFSNGTYATRSAVYRWVPTKRQFEVLQVLATQGAHGGRCFSVNDPMSAVSPSTAISSYSTGSISLARRSTITQSASSSSASAASATSSLFLAIANSRLDNTFSVNSTVWRYDPVTERFLMHQAVATTGAHDVEHMRLPLPAARGGAGSRFRRGDDGGSGSSGSSGSKWGSRATRAGRRRGRGDGAMVDVLVFANRGAEQVCSPSEHSPMLTWEPERQRFQQAAHLAGLQCATGLAAARLAETTLLLATGDRTANGSYTGPLTHVWRLEAEDSGAALTRRRALATSATAAEAGALQGRRRVLGSS